MQPGTVGLLMSWKLRDTGSYAEGWSRGPSPEPSGGGLSYRPTRRSGGGEHSPPALLAAPLAGLSGTESDSRGLRPGRARAVWNAPIPVSFLGPVYVICPPPTPQSSMGAKVAEASRLRPTSFGPGAGSLPTVHGVGGHDAAGRHEAAQGQPPGVAGHGAGAGAGDAAGERETVSHGRGVVPGPWPPLSPT